MKPKSIRGLIIALTGVCALVAATYAANLVAGGVLFALYKQDPRKATVRTMMDAWAATPDRSTRKRLIISMVVGGGLCIGGPLGLVAAATTTRRQLHGSARFAHTGDVKSAGLNGDDGILLGRFAGKHLRLPGSEFVLLAAPTRTGKGVSFVVPNLLTFKGSVVVSDIKGENWALTSRFRAEKLRQPVYCWNPFSESSHRFNPLSYVGHEPHVRVSDLQVLAAVLFPEQSRESPIWVDSARNLFVGLALLVLESPELPHTLGEVLRQASGKGLPLVEHLAATIQARDLAGKPLSTACRDHLSRFLAASENTLKGVLATFLAPLAVWGNPAVDKATSGDDFDVRDLRTRPMSVYVCVSARDVVAAGLLMNLFYSVCIGENLREQPQDNPALKYQALLLMDEFTAMGRVGIIAKAVTFMAGYNLRLALVIQDTAQLIDVYGRESGHNIISNMGATIHFTPSDLDEARRLSDLIGSTTERGRSTQFSSNASSTGGSTGRTLSYSEQARPVMLPQEVRLLDGRKELIVRAGVPVILADKARYFDDPSLRELFRSVGTSTVRVNGEDREVPAPLDAPAPNWELYEQTLLQGRAKVSAGAAVQSADGATGQRLDERIWSPQEIEAAAEQLDRRDLDLRVDQLAMQQVQAAFEAMRPSLLEHGEPA